MNWKEYVNKRVLVKIKDRVKIEDRYYKHIYPVELTEAIISEVSPSGDFVKLCIRTPCGMMPFIYEWHHKDELELVEVLGDAEEDDAK